MAVDEAGRVRVLTSVHTLHPEDQAVEDMLLGWRNQQLSRNLQFATIEPPRVQWRLGSLVSSVVGAGF